MNIIHHNRNIPNNEYTYSVKEVDKDGNPKTPAGYTNSVDGFKVTNKSKEGSWKPEVTKKLEGMDLEADKAPSAASVSSRRTSTTRPALDSSRPATQPFSFVELTFVFEKMLQAYGYGNSDLAKKAGAVVVGTGRSNIALSISGFSLLTDAIELVFLLVTSVVTVERSAQ